MHPISVRKRADNLASLRLRKEIGTGPQKNDRLHGHGQDLRFESHPVHFRSLYRTLWHTIGININRFRHVYPVATTTIQLSKEIKKTLESMKLHPRETYEEVLERILEDLRELSEQTKKEVEQAIREIKAGKYRTHEQLKSEMGY